MKRPAVYDSLYPPSERTFRGAIMMRLASGGADADELVDDFTDLAENFDEYFPDDAPVEPQDVPDVVDAVIEEYMRVVTEMSPDAEGLMTSMDDLLRDGILFSYGDAFDASDVMEYLQSAFEAVQAEGKTLRGYLYSLIGDLDELVLDGRLEASFGVFDGDSSEVGDLANRAVAILKRNGLAASWSGDPADPIVMEPMLVNAPLVPGDDDDDEFDDHEGHDHSN